MPVCQATLFGYAFAEISIPQFPVLPPVLLERNTPPAYIREKGHGAICPENKNKRPTAKSYLFSYMTVTLKVPLLKYLSICKNVYASNLPYDWFL